jgi:uncharacterized protein YjbJ (UPF0337 family)
MIVKKMLLLGTPLAIAWWLEASEAPATGIREHQKMAIDVLNSNWKEIRAHAKQWWGELTEDDLDEVEGRRDRLIDLLQQRYGHTREEAEVDVERFLVRASSFIRPNH